MWGCVHRRHSFITFWCGNNIFSVLLNETQMIQWVLGGNPVCRAVLYMGKLSQCAEHWAGITDTFQQIEHVVPCIYRHLGLGRMSSWSHLYIKTTRYTALNHALNFTCRDITSVQQTIFINNTMNSNFSFYFIITKIMRHEFVLKDNNKIKQIGRVFMH